uniref:Uncharacterized protein n=1 Tax=Anolis carolinensis TaxID=28377 RepID=A0A803T6P9_ANOCA
GISLPGIEPKSIPTPGDTTGPPSSDITSYSERREHVQEPCQCPPQTPYCPHPSEGFHTGTSSSLMFCVSSTTVITVFLTFSIGLEFA